MAVSVTDYTFIMFTKVKESKSSQTHAISILRFSPVSFAAPAISRRIWGLNERAGWLAFCVGEMAIYNKTGAQPGFKFELEG